jgi:drug/metabolite transporter (DMT)-like permease
MPFIGEISAVACSVASAGAITLFTDLSGKIGVYKSTLLRFFFAVLIIGATQYIAGGRLFEAYETRERLYYIIASGFVGFTIGDLFLFRSSVLLGPRLGTLVFITYVPMTTLLAIPLLGERLDSGQLIGMAVTLAGIALVITARRNTDPRYFIPQKLAAGAALGILGALCQATALVLAKMGMQGSATSTLGTLFVRLAAAFAGCLLAGLFTGQAVELLRRPPKRGIFSWTIVGTLLGPALSVWLSLIAVRYTYTGVATTLMALTPITIIPIAHITHKERLTLQMIAGTCAAVIGVALLFLM